MLTANGSHSRIAAQIALVVGIAAIFVLPSDAHAQRVRKKFKDKVHVVQPKPVLKKGRFELATRFGGSVNDSLNQSFKLGVQANWHLAESFYVGGMFDWFDYGGTLGGPTNAYETVSVQTGAAPDAAVVNWATGLEVGWVPVFGKFSFFNSSIIYYDFAVTGGGMFINGESIQNPSPKGKPGGTVSLSSRFFVGRWLAINFEVRDLIYTQDLIGASGSLTNIVTVGGGLSFFFPTEFEYSEKIINAPSN